MNYEDIERHKWYQTNSAIIQKEESDKHIACLMPNAGARERRLWVTNIPEVFTNLQLADVTLSWGKPEDVKPIRWQDMEMHQWYVDKMGDHIVKEEKNRHIAHGTKLWVVSTPGLFNDLRPVSHKLVIQDNVNRI
jgi:hypothetical protein